jgi:hypothetical protein
VYLCRGDAPQCAGQLLDANEQVNAVLDEALRTVRENKEDIKALYSQLNATEYAYYSEL